MEPSNSATAIGVILTALAGFIALWVKQYLSGHHEERFEKPQLVFERTEVDLLTEILRMIREMSPRIELLISKIDSIRDMGVRFEAREEMRDKWRHKD